MAGAPLQLRRRRIPGTAGHTSLAVPPCLLAQTSKPTHYNLKGGQIDPKGDSNTRYSVLTSASAEPSPGRHVSVRASLRAPSRQSPSGGYPRTHSAVSALGAALSESGS